MWLRGWACLAKEMSRGFDPHRGFCSQYNALKCQLLVRESPGSNPDIVHLYSAASGRQLLVVGSCVCWVDVYGSTDPTFP